MSAPHSQLFLSHLHEHHEVDIHEIVRRLPGVGELEASPEHSPLATESGPWGTYIQVPVGVSSFVGRETLKYSQPPHTGQTYPFASSQLHAAE